MKIKIGTRKSQLALKQADIVSKYLLGFEEISDVELVLISTSGDLNQNLNWKNSKESLKGLFTLEIEEKLESGEIDIAVHSLKDMPSVLKPGLIISGYYDACDNRDVLLTRDNKKLKELKPGSVIGTSSRRREVNILKQRQDLDIRPIRGNINTRINKLLNGEYDAIVLAYAGLKRLNLTQYISEFFQRDSFIPAPGQGILAIESKINHPINKLLKENEDKSCNLRAKLEREFATIFDGGCTTPVGCYVTEIEDKLYMKGFYEHNHKYYEASAYSVINDKSALAYIISNKIKSQYETPVGKVKLVGSGPGDVELLTLKAYKEIQKADIIFYDRLVSRQIIELANEYTLLVNVGKANNEGGTSQDKINQMLVNAAFKFENVVRLKGGDPFIFGRAYEECEVLEKYKIKYEIVPGISAFNGASSYSNIPLTIRNSTSGFSVFSGVSKLDYENISKSKETLIFYMSVSEGKNVAANLIKHGYDPKSSCAYIENATLKDQRVVKFKLEDIEETIREKNIKAPAILMISKNIDLALSYNWFNDVSKIKVMSTREDKHFDNFKKGFNSEKYEVENIAQIEIKLLDNNMSLESYDILLFNSINSVKSILKNKDVTELNSKIICAVGKKTKELLEANSITVDYLASKPTMKTLITEVKSLYVGKNILVTTSKEVAPKLENICDVYIAYETKNVSYEYKFIKDSILTTNVICFFSASAVDSFMKNINYNFELLNSIKIIVLGVTTNEALNRYNLEADIVSKEATQEGLIKEVKYYYENI